MDEITVQKPVVGDKPAGNHEPKKAVKAIQKNTNEKKKEPKKKLKIKDIPIIALLVALAGLFLAPIFLVLMNSFKGKLYIGTEPFAFPNENSFVGFDNYLEGADKIGFLPAFFTSLFITVFAVALLVLCTSMCAWFIVRVKKWYSQLLYLLCAFSMIVPFQMVMYPMTQVASKLHLNNIIGIIEDNFVKW